MVLWSEIRPKIIKIRRRLFINNDSKLYIYIYLLGQDSNIIKFYMYIYNVEKMKWGHKNFFTYYSFITRIYNILITSSGGMDPFSHPPCMYHQVLLLHYICSNWFHKSRGKFWCWIKIGAKEKRRQLDTQVLASAHVLRSFRSETKLLFYETTHENELFVNVDMFNSIQK